MNTTQKWLLSEMWRARVNYHRHRASHKRKRFPRREDCVKCERTQLRFLRLFSLSRAVFSAPVS